ncbi:agmatine deiminase family protein [Candidatus Micrarchaeota archaeon]|nr:agmatine deiminase family protein [Candidatus Micrarchaeota archaeon]
MAVRFPGEWEAHASTWLAWPHDALTFPDLEEVEKIWTQLVFEIGRGETVNLLAPERLFPRIPLEVRNHRHVVIHPVPTADVWLRDTGPVFVKESFFSVEDQGTLLATCFEFNAWGSKYHGHLADRGLNQKIAELAGVPHRTVSMVLEGGSIDSNGAGLCLTTEQCLLHRNRNPLLSRKQIEGKLKTHLGFTHVLWLGEGIQGDDTDGHVDDVARFLNPNTILYAVAEKGDANYKALNENKRRLERYATSFKFNLAEMPMPDPMQVDGQALPASYLNFYIANGTIILPSFDQPKDQEARSILKEWFPESDVVLIDGRSVVQGLGTFHCATQQQPA